MPAPAAPARWLVASFVAATVIAVSCWCPADFPAPRPAVAGRALVAQAGAQASRAYPIAAASAVPLDHAGSLASRSNLPGRPVSEAEPWPLPLASHVRGDLVTLPLPEGSASGRINLVVHEPDGVTRMAGELTSRRGSFSLTEAHGQLFGRVLLPNERLGYEISRAAGGDLMLVRKPLGDILCDLLPPEHEGPQGAIADAATAAPQAVPPLLSSRPGASAVLYLDFDGETVTDPDWNNGTTIVAAPSTLSSAQITEVWNRVKEDYAPFNIDVTTDVTRYNGAAIGRRMRCIITPTSAWFGPAGGVAYRFSFRQAGTLGYTTTVPCWVFNTTVNGIAEAVSHELGHTLGLKHDGDLNQPTGSTGSEYYGGHGSGAVSWGPIMGASYSRSLVQWSKGEYNGANNTEDDIAIIAGTSNGFGFVADEAGSTRATAAALGMSGASILQTGVITSSTDIDFYSFTLSGPASLTLTASPAAISPNLDLGLELQDANGVVLASANPDQLLGADVSLALAAGTYYVRVQGVGRGQVLSDGYSNYGSIGSYTLSGSVSSAVAPPTITTHPVAQSVSAGATVTFTVTASGSAPLSYRWQKGGTPIAGATGASLTLSNVQPGDAGAYAVVVSNSSGSVTSDTATLAVTVTIGVIAAETAAGHTLFLRADGTLWAMGNNDTGQLGDGTTVRRMLPVQVAANVVTFSTGSYHNLFIKSDGTLWGVGSNTSGQLGDGTMNNRFTPIQIASNVAAVAAGNAHSAFIKTDGSLWLVGQNGSGQIGDGSFQNRLVPVQVAANAVAVSAGQGHTAFVRNDGTLWGMGFNSAGELGDGTTTTRTTPVQIATNVAAVDCGAYHTFFLKTSGELWGTGYNYAGSFGTGTTTDYLSPVLITAGVSAFSAGYTTNLYVKAGTLHGVGLNNHGQLGLGTTTFVEPAPQPITTNVATATTELYSSLFIKNDGSLWGMGENAQGQLGDGFTIDRMVPVPVATGTVAVPASPLVSAGDGTQSTEVRLTWTPVIGATSYDVWRGSSTDTATAVRIASGLRVPFYDDFAAAPGTTYFYWVRASNLSGTSGFGVPDSGMRGAGVPPVITTQPVAQNVTGGAPVTFTIVATGDPTPTLQWQRLPALGSVWAPLPNGGNFAGVTTPTLAITTTAAMNGDQFRCVATNAGGSAISAAATLAVVDLPGVVQVAMGTEHSFFIRADGTLWAQGRNTFGQLGDGTTTDRLRPVQVATGAIAAAAGADFSLMLKADGSLWTTGGNGSGQLGTGSGSGSRTTFAQMATGVVAIAAGAQHALYLKSDGSLWAMGDNIWGELGVNVFGSSMVPVQVASNVAGCSANRYHSLFVKTDGTLWACGANDYYQLGDGTLTPRTLPIQVATNVVVAAAGWYHSTFLKTDGTVWGMGNNSSGQNGDGLPGNHPTPAPMNIAGVVALTNGISHSLMLKADRTLWGTGYNYLGQLGYQSEFPGVSAPVQMAANISAVAAGGHATLYVGLDGGLWATGDNAYGQLGDGTTTQRMTPVKITGGSLPVPAEPAGLAATDGTVTGAVRLTWAATLGANRYEVWRSPSDNPAGAVLLNAQVRQAVFTDTTGSSGVAFFYWVKSANGAGVSGFSPSDRGYHGSLPTAPTIAGQPQHITANLGQAASLGVVASSDAAVTYQWRKNGVAIAGATSATLAFAAVQPGDAGNYDVVVANLAGSVTSATAALTVRVPPAVATAPQTQVAVAGGSVTFNVGANGTGPLAYQWNKAGVAIAGATSATLQLAGVQAGDTGAYSVTVTNAAGAATSPSAFLHVFPSLPYGAHAAGPNVYRPGGTVTITNTVAFAGAASGLSCEVLLPAGWSVVSSSGALGERRAAAGTTSLAEWRWSSVPVAPVTFTYTLAVPATQAGPVQIVAHIIVQQGSDAGTPLLAQPDPLVLALATQHTADSDADFRISLAELTRVIELYNTRNGNVRTGSYRPRGVALRGWFCGRRRAGEWSDGEPEPLSFGRYIAARRPDQPCRAHAAHPALQLSQWQHADRPVSRAVRHRGWVFAGAVTTTREGRGTPVQRPTGGVPTAGRCRMYAAFVGG